MRLRILYTGKVEQTFPEATDAEVIRAIENAHKAFLSWKKTSFAERANIMQKAANLLRKDMMPTPSFPPWRWAS